MNADEKTVTARAMGIFSSTALYRDGCGCTISGEVRIKITVSDLTRNARADKESFRFFTFVQKRRAPRDRG
ncbi:MAG: hypothetical protein COX20_01050 [Desulfobacterales bacterium CG23_combo_of_CG06-09_8_20_14_all_52_9]|nr:MAG: hypothetical protein COX20_01050 [Desulfobacterales bacterium CG23_combo_of_CG06-09_8_20_14_all_52_9]